MRSIKNMNCVFLVIWCHSEWHHTSSSTQNSYEWVKFIKWCQNLVEFWGDFVFKSFFHNNSFKKYVLWKYFYIIGYIRWRLFLLWTIMTKNIGHSVAMIPPDDFYIKLGVSLYIWIRFKHHLLNSSGYKET